MKQGCLIVALGMLAAQQAQSQGMLGPEFQVNSTATGEQYSATVIGGEGGFVVVWAGSSDGSYSGVFGRRLAADGSPIGVDFPINTVTASHQGSAAAATGPDGGFVVTWTNGDLSVGGESNIAARSFDSAGNPLSSDEVRVNTFTTGRQSTPAVAGAQDGSFVVVWRSPVYGYPNYEIRARRLASDGSPLGEELQVNASTSERQLYPSVSSVAGGFVVAWHIDLGADDFDIAARFLTSDGNPTGDDFQISTYNTGMQAFPVVDTAPSGDFLIAWQSFGSIGNDQDSSVQARLFSSDGTPRGDQVQVNTYTSGSQLRPDVAATADGGFVATWTDGSAFSGGQDGDSYGIFARTIATDGTPAGDEFQVNAYTTFAQRIPGIARVGDRFVVAWQGTRSGVGRDIWARRLSPGLVFYDGFESGDLSNWSITDP